MRDGTPGGSMHPVFEVHEGTAGRRVVHLVGPLDIATSGAVEEALRSALEGGGPVRLDLSDVTFMDSSGMRSLLRAFRLARERDAAFELIPGPPVVQRVLHVTGLADLLTFVERDDPTGPTGA
jgi:anti-sigma B factor antagonist